MYKIEHIAQILRQAREEKGLSQRALSERVGLQQSHISNIENSTVDLKTSNLIELSRALELEPILVPRTLINTVKAMIRAEGLDEDQPPPAYRIDED